VASFVPSTFCFQIDGVHCALTRSKYGGQKNVDICALESHELDECVKMKSPGTPAEINFLRRLRKIRVDTRRVVSLYCFMFHCQIKVNYCFMARISDVGQSIVDINVQKTRLTV
jgi:hypothetical protein